mgnify:CR=1 FL=1
MKKNLIYCVSAAILAMVFMLAGQANAESGCEAPSWDGSSLQIQCGSTDDNIEVFVDNEKLFVDIGDGPVGYDFSEDFNFFQILIYPGDGNDNVSIHDLAVSWIINIESGPGDDVVSVGPEVEADFLRIVTGPENDAIHLGLNVLVGLSGVYVDAGLGQDRLATFSAVPLGFGGITTEGDISLIGGTDTEIISEETDKIVISNDSLIAARGTIVTEWEVFGTRTE